MVKIPSLDLKKIQETIQATVVRGSIDSYKITKISEPEQADQESISYLISDAFLSQLPNCKAKALVVNKALVDKVIGQIPISVTVVLSCEDAYWAMAKVSEMAVKADPSLDWTPFHPGPANSKDGSAQIDSSAIIGAGCTIGARTKVGARVQLIGNVTIGSDVVIGDDSVIFPGVVIYPKTTIGKRARIHSNVVIGGDGFGYARGKTGATKIWHLGRVQIGDDVEIGPGTTIDRGTLKDTIIENGVKLDNLIQIGHNVHIKAHTVICAQTGIGGNAVVGMGTLIAAKAGIGDKVEIGDRAIIGPNTGISKDVKPGEIMMGTFLGRPRREWWKLAALVDRLPELNEKIKKIEKHLFPKNE